MNLLFLKLLPFAIASCAILKSNDSSNAENCELISKTVSESLFRKCTHYSDSLNNDFYIVDTTSYFSSKCNGVYNGRNVVVTSEFAGKPKADMLFFSREVIKDGQLILVFYYPLKNVGMQCFFTPGKEKKLTKLKIIDL